MAFANSSWAPAGVMAVVLLLTAAPAGGQQSPEAASPPAAVRQFRDAVAFQDRGVYDLAADEWQAFLDKFPDDPLAPKAQHYLGVCRLLLKQYDAAAESLARVLREHPDSELADSSYLNLGLAQYSLARGGRSESYDEAAKTLRALVAKFPESKELPQALYYLGEALYARGHKQDAATAYQRLVDAYPESALAPDALYALGVARQELDETQQAGAAFDRFIKTFPRHKLRAEVIMRRAETLYTLGHFEPAARWFRSAAASKDFKLADLAAMRQAQSLEAAKKFAAAAPLYAALAEKFPESSYRQPALLAAGNCYLAVDDLAAAEKAYRAVIDAGGDLQDDAAHWLARAYLKHGKPREALATVERVLPDSSKGNFAAPLLLDRADAVYEIPDRRDEAVALYAAVAAQHPDDAVAPQALYMAAFAALGQRDYQAAAQYSQQFLGQYADRPLAADVRYVAAEAALQLKQYDRAEKLYAELAKAHPDHADLDSWKVRRALCLHLQEKFAEVVDALAPLVDQLKSPEMVAEAQYLLGSAHAGLGKHEPAAKSLEASLAAAPRGPHADDALLALAAVQRQTSSSAEAVATLGKLSAEFPESPLADEASYRAGEYSLAAGELDQAAGHYQRVIDTWPESPLVPHALYGLAWSRLATGDRAAATRSLDRLLDKYPKHPTAAKARYARAMAREQEGDYAGARDDIAAFLATDPPRAERSEAVYVQGLALVGLQEFDEAAESFRSILADEPNFAGADKVLYELAWALRSAGKSPEALKAFSQLARQHADSPLAAEAFYHLGEDAYGRGDYAQAAAFYDSAKKRAGGDQLGEKAAHKLGWSLYQQGKLQPAADAFQAQLTDFPDGELAPDALFMTAEALFNQNKFEAAWAAYQKSFERPSQNDQWQALAHLHAGQALAQQGNWSESFRVLDSAIGEFPDSTYLPELRYEAAWAQQNLGKPDEALARYEQVVAQTDREVAARARFMIGEILFEKRDYKEAIRNFFKVAYGYGYPESPEPVRVWQANASYEAGRCFEVLKMVDQAKKSYQEVVERYPESDKAALAKNRLENLGA